MKRFIILISVIIAGFGSLHAQFTGLGVAATYTLHTPKSPSFTNFFNTYNQVNSNIIKEPFDEGFGAFGGFGWHLSWAVNNGGLDFRANSGVSYLTARNKVVLVNNDERRLRLSSHDWTVDMGLGGGNENFFFNFNVGMNLRMSNLYSSYVFSDGTVSFGMDHSMNGIYNAWRLTGLLGATVGFGAENLNLYFKMDWVPPTQDDDTYKASYTDLQDFKSGNSTYFPQDMVRYSSGTIDFFNNAFNDFSGMRFTLGLQINLISEL